MVPGHMQPAEREKQEEPRFECHELGKSSCFHRVPSAFPRGGAR